MKKNLITLFYMLILWPMLSKGQDSKSKSELTLKNYQRIYGIDSLKAARLLATEQHYLDNMRKVVADTALTSEQRRAKIKLLMDLRLAARDSLTRSFRAVSGFEAREQQRIKEKGGH